MTVASTTTSFVTSVVPKSQANVTAAIAMTSAGSTNLIRRKPNIKSLHSLLVPSANDTTAKDTGYPPLWHTRLAMSSSLGPEAHVGRENTCPPLCLSTEEGKDAQG